MEKLKHRQSIISAILVFALAVSTTALADDDSDDSQYYRNTSIQYGYSWSADNDFIIGYGSEEGDRHQIRFEHQHDWKYGENYIFADVIISSGVFGGDNAIPFGFPCCGDGKTREAFGLINSNLSLSKVSGTPIKFGPIKDIALEARVEYGSFFNYYAVGLGASIYLDIPGIVEKPGDKVQLVYWRRFNDDDFVSGAFDAGGVATTRYADHNFWGLNIRKDWYWGKQRLQHQTFLRFQQATDGSSDELARFNRIFFETELFAYVTDNLSVGFRSEYFYDAGGISFGGVKSDWRPIVAVKWDW